MSKVCIVTLIILCSCSCNAFAEDLKPSTVGKAVLHPNPQKGDQAYEEIKTWGMKEVKKESEPEFDENEFYENGVLGRMIKCRSCWDGDFIFKEEGIYIQSKNIIIPHSYCIRLDPVSHDLLNVSYRYNGNTYSAFYKHNDGNYLVMKVIEKLHERPAKSKHINGTGTKNAAIINYLRSQPWSRKNITFNRVGSISFLHLNKWHDGYFENTRSITIKNAYAPRNFGIGREGGGYYIDWIIGSGPGESDYNSFSPGSYYLLDEAKECAQAISKLTGIPYAIDDDIKYANSKRIVINGVENKVGRVSLQKFMNKSIPGQAIVRLKNEKAKKIDAEIKRLVTMNNESLKELEQKALKSLEQMDLEFYLYIRDECLSAINEFGDRNKFDIIVEDNSNAVVYSEKLISSQIDMKTIYPYGNNELNKNLIDINSEIISLGNQKYDGKKISAIAEKYKIEWP